MLHYLKEAFQYRKKRLIGLDLGFNEIRLLQLAKNAQGFHLEKIVDQAFPPLSPGIIPSWSAVGESLKELVARLSLSGSAVALAMPSHAIIKRQIKLPSYLQADEMQAELELHLARYFPDIPEKELCFDFILRATKEESHDILVVAARKSQLHDEVESVRRAGLNVVLVEVDVYSLARAGAAYFYKGVEDESAPALLLDLRWPLCSLLAFRQDDIFFQQQWRVEKTVFESPLSQLPSLVRQMKAMWQLCKSSHPKLNFNKLVLAGDFSQLILLIPHIEAAFSMAVELLDPFKAMSSAVGFDSQRLQALYPRFISCCGLAMRVLA